MASWMPLTCPNLSCLPALHPFEAERTPQWDMETILANVRDVSMSEASDCRQPHALCSQNDGDALSHAHHSSESLCISQPMVVCGVCASRGPPSSLSHCTLCWSYPPHCCVSLLLPRFLFLSDSYHSYPQFGHFQLLGLFLTELASVDPSGRRLRPACGWIGLIRSCNFCVFCILYVSKTDP